LHERISTIKLLGIIIGAAGALILIGGKGIIGFNHQKLVGDLMLLANSVSYAIYLAIVRPLMQKYNAFTVSKWLFLFGGILFFPVGYNELISTHWHLMPASIVWALIYIVIGTTFITYLLINYALKSQKTTTISIYIYIQPVVAAIIATIIGMDRITILSVLASILVFAGVYLVSRENEALHNRQKIK
jgi:drug/metabolite transporter (DMT)-like permease